jgi:hypothetical protein
MFATKTGELVKHHINAEGQGPILYDLSNIPEKSIFSGKYK